MSRGPHVYFVVFIACAGLIDTIINLIQRVIMNNTNMVLVLAL